MTYDLFIGDQLFSSWSMRGQLMLEQFGLPFNRNMVGLYTRTMAQDLAPLAPARLVPVLRLPDGTVVGESIAMAETLAERHPEAGLWPTAPGLRATARWLCSEMATGFSALRTDCPMQLHSVYKGFQPSDAVRADLERIETLWTHARGTSGALDGWLFGARSLADVFYTLVAARIVGYDLPVSSAARSYCDMLLGDPAVLNWRADALKISYDPMPYDMGLKQTPWPNY